MSYKGGVYRLAQDTEVQDKEMKLFGKILIHVILLVALLPLPLYHFLKLSIFSVEITDYFSFWYFMLCYIALLFFVPMKNIKNNFIFFPVFGFWSIASIFTVDYFFSSVTIHGFSYLIIPACFWLLFLFVQLFSMLSKKTPTQ